MDGGTRSLFSDHLEASKLPHYPMEAAPHLGEEVKPSLPLALDGTNSHLNSVADTFKTHFGHGSDDAKSLLMQGLEGTMALLAARGSMEGSPKTIYPLPIENVHPLIPYGGDGIKSYIQERIEKSHKPRERKESSRGSESVGTPECGTTGEIKRTHERTRDHKGHTKKVPDSPKSQLSNPRHDAHLVHAIRELHEEEFGLDAVLLAEGGHVGAHCAVLAAASPFLKSLLLHSSDHPAIISVTGTALSTLQALVTCLYTGSIPASASLYHLAEAAKLLRMDDLTAVLQKTFIAQGGTVLEMARAQSAARAASYGGTDLRFEKLSGKKNRRNRLDQILYQKLNVNHLAPSDPPDLCPIPPASPRVTFPDPIRVAPPEPPRIPPLEPPRVPPLDLRGGILGELLTKADPLRTVFAGGGYPIADLGFDASGSSLKPLNLSKPNKSQSSSTPEMLSHTSSSCSSSVNSSTSTSTSCSLPTSSLTSSLASSLTSQTELNLSGLTSLAPTLPGSMSSLLTPITPTSMMTSSALASLTSSSAFASLGAHHSITSASSKSKSTSSGNRNRSSSSSKRNSSNRQSSSSSDTRKSSQHTLPLLYTLKSGLMTPEVAKEVYEHLKLDPQLASLPGLDNLNSLSNLSSSASLQSLANLHNLTSVQGFPALFPFLAPPPPPDSALIGNVGASGSSGIQDSYTLPGPPPSDHLTTETASETNSNLVSEDQGVLNLSSSASLGPQGDAVTRCNESPSLKPTEDCTVNHADLGDITESTSINDPNHLSGVLGTEMDPARSDDNPAVQSAPSTCDMSTSCPTPVPQNLTEVDPEQMQNENIEHIPNGSVAVSFSQPLNSMASSNPLLRNSIEGSSLPLLLMSSGAVASMTQPPVDVTKAADISTDTHFIPKQEPCVVSPENGDTADDNGIEVIEEFTNINRSQPHFQARKMLYHAGHMGRKRKGCGECEGCQVVEDCGQCRFCRDKAKFGGPNRLKQVCVYKRCVLAELEPEESKKRRKTSGKKSRGKCGGCDGCQRTSDCNECYACLHNAAAQPPARRKVCEMRVCEQQQMEEVRAALSVAGEPSPYSTDSVIAESINLSSGASSPPTPDGHPSTHNDKMKLMRKMLKKKFAQPYSRVSPSKVRTKYYCGECPGCQTTTPCGHCLYCEDMPKFGGPGRYRQKCVKQLCVYHPRLQALKLSNRTKTTYDEQHIAPATLTHLDTTISCPADEAVDLVCADSRENMEELDSLEGIEHGDEADELTEGEDSNATINVDNPVEETGAEKDRPPFILEDAAPEAIVATPDIPNITPPAENTLPASDATTTANSAIPAVTTVTTTCENSCVLVPPVPCPSPLPLALVPSPTNTCVANVSSPVVITTDIHMPTPAKSPSPLVASTTKVSPTPTPKASPTNTPRPSPTPTPTPTPTTPTPTPAPESSAPETENTQVEVPEVECEEDLEDEVDDEEDEEILSDASDIASLPSTPSPQPKLRGRGRYRGRGRARGKKTGGVTTRRAKRALRRGLRRRTTRFTLEPEDNSDFEEQLDMANVDEGAAKDEHAVVEDGGGKAQNSTKKSKENATQKLVDNSEKDKQTKENSASTTGDGDPGYSVIPKSSSKFVNKSQNTDPDVFEFQDSPESVIEKKEMTNSVTLKHNGPYVFQSEELGQGGRDVNENVGTLGEASTT